MLSVGRWALLLLLSPFLHATDWRPATEHPLDSPSLPKPARVFLPENWSPDRNWPAIFFYPWTGGEANLEVMRSHTANRDFIIVGLPPRQDGQFAYTAETVALEQESLREIRDRLAAETKLDPTRVYVAGFSKGGWLAGIMLAHEPSLAGGCVLGAGWIHHQHTAPKKITAPLYVYIGVGRFDGNFPASLRASQEFTKLGARVTLDVWPDLGHAKPKGGSEGLRQWLALIARGAEARPDAVKWTGQELTRISSLTEPVEEWSALRHLGTFPYAKAAGEDLTKKIRERLSTLERQPAIAAEASLLRELDAIHQREIQDIQVTTLEAVGPRYETLAKKSPHSIAGKLAVEDAARIEKLWEGVPGGKPAGKQ